MALKKEEEKENIFKNKGIMTILFILLIMFVITIFMALYMDIFLKNKNQATINEINSETNNLPECSSDTECVPSSCCHANECVPAILSPSCKGIACSMECSALLDCKQGKCACINSKCSVLKTPLE